MSDFLLISKKREGKKADKKMMINKEKIEKIERCATGEALIVTESDAHRVEKTFEELTERLCQNQTEN